MGINGVSVFGEGKKRTAVVAVAYLSLAITKIVAGFFFNSTVILADGIHSSIDALTALIVFLGLLLADRYPSERFPFGLYKAENMASLFVAMAIGFAAIDIIEESVFSKTTVVGEPMLLIGIEVVSAVVCYLAAIYLRSMSGLKLDAVQAQGVHALQDVLASLAVIVGVIGEWISLYILAVVVGVGIAIYIIYQAYFIGRDSVMTLLDAGDKDATERIKTIVSKMEGTIGVHEIKTRKAGPFLFATMHLEAPPASSVKEADMLADKVEENLRSNMPSLLTALIHVEPGSYSGKWKIAIFETKDNRIARNVEETEQIAVYDTTKGRTEALFPGRLETGKMDKLAADLKSKGVEAIIIGEDESRPLLAFKANGIEVYGSQIDDEISAVDLFLKGKLIVR